MNKTTIIGIDLAKDVFGVVVRDQDQQIIKKQMMREGQLISFLSNHEAATVAMESCGTSNYWARRVQAMGHTAKLIPPQHVKPYLRGNKNDINDAIAISDAALNPAIHEARAKTLEEQDIQSLLRVRSHITKSLTATGNQIRGLLAEYGIKIPKGKAVLRRQIPRLLEDAENGLTVICRHLLAKQYECYLFLEEQQQDITRELETCSKQHEAIQRLQTIPGFGAIVAASFFSVYGDGSHFKNGRGAAAALGLVPRQHSSGGKIALGHISKRGDRHLRSLLVHGARSVMIHAAKKEDKLHQWAVKLKANKGSNKAVVALANKLARIAWAVLTSGESYRVAI